MAFTPFDEVDFPVGVLSYGSTSGHTFSTDVILMNNGTERRNINWSSAKHKFSVQTGNQPDKNMALLTAFHKARYGRGKGFRIQDPADHTTGMYGRDAPGMTAKNAQIFGVGDGSTTVFQLCKVYGASAPYYIRPIFKPTAGTVAVYSGDKTAPTEVLAGWTLDTVNGVVIFAAAPAAGLALWWSGVFSIPMRFDADDIAASYVDGHIRSATIDIVEITYAPIGLLLDASVLS